MLPFFKIIKDDNDKMQHSKHDVPQKPKRNKKLEVPVHGDSANQAKQKPSDHHQKHKTFSANFNGRRNKYENELISELSENVNRISKRVLTKENEKLQNQIIELVNVQDHLNKKNCKLKEKLTSVFTANEELASENNLIKAQYEELVKQYNLCVNELEKPKVCQNCLDLNDLLDKTRRDYMSLKKLNQEMHEDCGMLKNVVYRLNVQLERYQQKMQQQQHNKTNQNDYHLKSDTSQSDNVNLGEGHYDHLHTPISWGKVNTHTLAPLLNAYQDAVIEKEAIIDAYEVEFAEFTGKLKEVIKENEGLHVKLTEDAECSKVLSAQLEGLKTELKAVREQNDLLIKKCALKQDKIEEILKCYEQKVDQLKRDYAVLQDQYARCKSEVVGLKEKNKSLESTHDDFKNERSQYIPISVHTSSVNECKRWYEELKAQYEIEKSKLAEAIEQLRDQVKDLTAKITALNNEKLELEAKLKTADKHIKKAETKHLELEHSLHEVQLSRSACRKQLHKAMSFAKDLVNEQETLLTALNQRQHENKVVKKLGSDIASRMDLLRNQLKTVQRDAWQELTTVESRIQEQNVMIDSMRQEHEEEVERLKEIIREKEGNILFKENSSIPMTQYVLVRDKHK